MIIGREEYGDYSPYINLHIARFKDVFKAKHPGNYIIEDHFNQSSLTVVFNAVFDTPEDETCFRLKYQ